MTEPRDVPTAPDDDLEEPEDEPVPEGNDQADAPADGGE